MKIRTFLITVLFILSCGVAMASKAPKNKTKSKFYINNNWNEYNELSDINKTFLNKFFDHPDGEELGLIIILI